MRMAARAALFAPLLLLVTHASWAAPPDVPGLELAWRTEKVLASPESVVHDPARGVLYVSSINGEGTDEDGNGFLSRVGLDGRVLDRDWVTGLDGPKGLAFRGDLLFVADIHQVAVVDVAAGVVLSRHPAPGAKFLNDVAVDELGRVFVSDTMGKRLYLFDGVAVRPWGQDPLPQSPNGLHAEPGRLIVGTWGVLSQGFSTSVPGHLMAVDLLEGASRDLGSGAPVGNLDGVEAAGSDSYWVTDWMDGSVHLIFADGTSRKILQLSQGAADHEVLHEEGLLVVPMMKDDVMLAYRITP